MCTKIDVVCLAIGYVNECYRDYSKHFYYGWQTLQQISIETNKINNVVAYVVPCKFVQREFFLLWYAVALLMAINPFQNKFSISIERKCDNKAVEILNWQL